MNIINPNSPMFNTLIFYLMCIFIILIIKPSFMYCHKNKKFKSFGCRRDQSLFSFPIITIIISIVIYMIFLCLDILFTLLSNK